MKAKLLELWMHKNNGPHDTVTMKRRIMSALQDGLDGLGWRSDSVYAKTQWRILVVIERVRPAKKPVKTGRKVKHG